MGDEFIFHLFNWQIICAPIQQRGLGVREVVYFNKALLGKWLRQFAMEEQALWRTVVARKCGCEWGWLEFKGSVGRAWLQFVEVY